ncbi:unnamed protein product, partial [Oikopleura dioica]
MNPSEYEKMKEDLKALNLEEKQKLVKDAQIEEAMQKLRDEIDEQIQKNEELKTKYKSTKADLHKTGFLKSEQLKANLKQYHRTKELSPIWTKMRATLSSSSARLILQKLQKRN